MTAAKLMSSQNNIQPRWPFEVTQTAISWVLVAITLGLAMHSVYADKNRGEQTQLAIAALIAGTIFTIVYYASPEAYALLVNLNQTIGLFLSIGLGTLCTDLAQRLCNYQPTANAPQPSADVGAQMTVMAESFREVGFLPTQPNPMIAHYNSHRTTHIPVEQLSAIPDTNSVSTRTEPSQP